MVEHQFDKTNECGIGSNPKKERFIWEIMKTHQMW
jgi:hypothetical protein